MISIINNSSEEKFLSKYFNGITELQCISEMPPDYTNDIEYENTFCYSFEEDKTLYFKHQMPKQVQMADDREMYINDDNLNKYNSSHKFLSKSYYRAYSYYDSKYGFERLHQWPVANVKTNKNPMFDPIIVVEDGYEYIPIKLITRITGKTKNEDEDDDFELHKELNGENGADRYLAKSIEPFYYEENKKTEKIYIVSISSGKFDLPQIEENTDKSKQRLLYKRKLYGNRNQITICEGYFNEEEPCTVNSIYVAKIITEVMGINNNMLLNGYHYTFVDLNSKEFYNLFGFKYPLATNAYGFIIFRRKENLFSEDKCYKLFNSDLCYELIVGIISTTGTINRTDDDNSNDIDNLYNNNDSCKCIINCEGSKEESLSDENSGSLSIKYEINRYPLDMFYVMNTEYTEEYYPQSIHLSIIANIGYSIVGINGANKYSKNGIIISLKSVLENGIQTGQIINDEGNKETDDKKENSRNSLLERATNNCWYIKDYTIKPKYNITLSLNLQNETTIILTQNGDYDCENIVPDQIMVSFPYSTDTNTEIIFKKEDLSISEDIITTYIEGSINKQVYGFKRIMIRLPNKYLNSEGVPKGGEIVVTPLFKDSYNNIIVSYEIKYSVGINDRERKLGEITKQSQNTQLLLFNLEKRANLNNLLARNNNKKNDMNSLLQSTIIASCVINGVLIILIIIITIVTLSRKRFITTTVTGLEESKKLLEIYKTEKRDEFLKKSTWENNLAM